MSLGNNVKNLRRKKGYSIMKIRELTGLSKSTISELENDKSSPTAETLKKIADAIDVNVEEFFKEHFNEASPEYIHSNIDNTKLHFEPHASMEEQKKQSEAFDLIPEEFTSADEARIYIGKHQIFSSDGFNVNKLSDEEVLEFANALLDQMKMVSYKYRK